MPRLELRGSTLDWIRRILPRHGFRVVFLLSVLSLTFVISVLPGVGQLSANQVLPTDGVISYGEHLPPGLILLYSTDFESVTRGDGSDTYSLALGYDVNGVKMGNYFLMDGAASWWIEGVGRSSGVTAHSGSRSIGMETGTGGYGGERNEFNIQNLQNHVGSSGDITGKQVFVSVWLYWKPTFDIYSGGWYSFAVTYQSAVEYPVGSGVTLPIQENHIHKYDGYETAAEWGTPGSSIEPATVLNTIPNYHPPFGRWWNLQYWVYFDHVNGKVKVWVDGNVLLDITNLDTLDYAGQRMLTTIAKIYHSYDSNLWQLWVDDFEIYGNP